MPLTLVKLTHGNNSIINTLFVKLWLVFMTIKVQQKGPCTLVREINHLRQEYKLLFKVIHSG